MDDPGGPGRHGRDQRRPLGRRAPDRSRWTTCRCGTPTGSRPSIALTSPAEGTRSDRPLTLAADAPRADASGVEEVAFLVDGAVIERRTTPPYTAVFDEPVTAGADGDRHRTRGRHRRQHGRDGASRRSCSCRRTPRPRRAARPATAGRAPWRGSRRRRRSRSPPTTVPAPGVQEIRYTTDGSDPGPGAGSVYTGPIDVTQTTDLAWLAIDREGNAEPVHRTTLAVDAQAPSVSLSCDLGACAEAWRATPTTVAVSASDLGTGVQEIRYTTDGSTPDAHDRHGLRRALHRDADRRRAGARLGRRRQRLVGHRARRPHRHGRSVVVGRLHARAVPHRTRRAPRHRRRDAVRRPTSPPAWTSCSCASTRRPGPGRGRRTRRR